MSVMLLLRLVHVVIGVLWAGSVFFVAMFVLPTLRALGPGSGPVMNELVGRRKMPLYLMAFAILTVLSGATLLWKDMQAFGPAWMSTGPGRTFSIGGAIAIFTALFGAVVNAPAGKKLADIGEAVRASGGPPSAVQAAEIARLQGRLNSATQVAAVLILLATMAMAVARYVP
jgi:hypothetical protein